MKAAIALLLAASTAVAADRKTASPRGGMPRVFPPGKVWISSVPVGLEVTAGRKPAGSKVLGRTPLLVDSKAFEPFGGEVTVSLRVKKGRKLPSQADLVDFTAVTNHAIWIRNGTVDTEWGRALTYRVGPKSPTAIALFQPKSASLSEWARQYPSGKSFPFSEDPARKDLAAKGVPAAYVDLVIRLLGRGGKVAVPGRDGWLVAEVRPPGVVAITAAPR